MTTVDLTPVIQLAVSFLAVILPALAGYIAWVLKQKMDIQQNSADAALIDMAASRAGGLAYSFLAKEATDVPHSVDMRNAAVATGLNHMVAAVPDALKRQGVTTDTITRMVAAEVGKLEASDPNVTIGPVAAPAVVVPVVEPALAPALPVAAAA